MHYMHAKRERVLCKLLLISPLFINSLFCYIIKHYSYMEVKMVNLSSSSSIALLQERFKQLEKMKELRQEKELLRRHGCMMKEHMFLSPPQLSLSTAMHPSKLTTAPDSSFNLQSSDVDTSLHL